MNRRSFVAVIAVVLAVSACGRIQTESVGGAESDGSASTDTAELAEVTKTAPVPRELRPAIDGELDCPPWAVKWSMQGSALHDTVGTATPEEELDTFLAPWFDRFGGDIVQVREGVGALLVDGSEVVISYASPAPAGGWVVLTTVSCDGFQL